MLIAVLLKFLYVLVTTNTEPIKCNGGAHDTADRIIVKGLGNAVSNTSSPVNVMWPSKRLVPTVECGPPQHQHTVLMTNLRMFLVTDHKGSNMSAIPAR